MAMIWAWITDLGNSKMVALVLFMTTFIAILLYIFGSPKRSRQYEDYRYIPLNDDEDPRDPYHSHERREFKTEHSPQELGRRGEGHDNRHLRPQGQRKS